MTKFFKMVMICLIVTGIGFICYADDMEDEINAFANEFSKDTTDHPLSYLGAFDSGDTKYNLKDYKSAIVYYTKAIELDPQNVATLSDNRSGKKTILNSWVYKNRGLAKENLQDYQGAFADYTKAIELDPQDTSSYMRRIYTECKLRDYQGVIADITKAIELDSGNALFYHIRGIAKLNFKDYQGSIADITNAIKLDPQNASSYNDRGWSYLWMNEWQNAQTDLLKSIELDNKIPFAYSNIAICYWKAEKNKMKALEYFEKSFQNGFDQWNALYDNTSDGHFIGDLNQTPEFKALVEKYRKTSGK
jgi:tetratricopeptide (TPR) repeat protein